MLRSFFINLQESRLRAGWRLLLQLILFFGGLIVINLIIGLAAGAVMALMGSELQVQQLLVQIISHPLARMVGALISLVVILLSYWITARWLDRRPVASYGLRFNARWWGDLGFGLFLGAFLMALIFTVERATGWAAVTGYFQSNQQGIPFAAAILIDLVVFLCVGIYEEMLFRGYQVKNLAEGLNFKRVGPRMALLLAFLGTSLFFGWMHAGNPNATFTSTLGIVAAGLFLGLGYVLTGELAIPIGLHITWNFFQGSVFGFPVSGTDTAASFITIQQGGPAAWTGGAFGPEAGLLGLFALILGSLMIIWWVRRRWGRATLDEKIAVYGP